MNRKTLLIIGGALVGVCVLCVIVVGLIFGTSLFLTQGAADVGEQFLGDLRDGKWSDAYQLCDASLQNEVGSPTNLGTLVKNGKATPKSWTITNRNVNGDRAELSGNVNFAEGTNGTVELVIVKAGSNWKVAGFNLTPQ